MSIVFLFGAGASYGSGECYPHPPPLGKDLFPELLRRGEIAAVIDEDLRQQFEDNFEKGMERFFEVRNVSVSTVLREMGKYFAPFTIGPNNLYWQLIDKLAQRQQGSGETIGQRAILATTNYELLLEHAIINSNCAVVYPDPDREPDLAYARFPSAFASVPVVRDSPWAETNYSITVGFPAFEVLKVHGSCNLLPDIPPGMLQNVQSPTTQ